MAKIFPWDVRIAAALAAIVLLVRIFEFGRGLFAAIYLTVCIYVAINTFRAKADS